MGVEQQLEADLLPDAEGVAVRGQAEIDDRGARTRDLGQVARKRAPARGDDSEAGPPLSEQLREPAEGRARPGFATGFRAGQNSRPA